MWEKNWTMLISTLNLKFVEQKITCYEEMIGLSTVRTVGYLKRLANFLISDRGKMGEDLVAMKFSLSM